MAKKNEIACGLGDLLSDVGSVYQGLHGALESQRVHNLDIDSIRPNPHQVRREFSDEALQELAASIEKHGLLQPVLVRRDIEDDCYVLLAGERRLRASKLAGLSEIKAIIIEVEDSKLRELALIENIQRENLNPIELALGYQSLIQEHGLTHEALSKVLAKSRAQITNTLRLLSLSDEAKDLLTAKKLTQGHAKVLAGVDSKLEKIALDQIVENELSVRETEALVRRLKASEILESNKDEDKQEQDSKKTRLDALKLKELKDLLGGYGIRAKARLDSITLSFCDNSALQAFIESLRGQCK